jgi:membrane protease YdiL (CAAX protease family)
MTPGLFEHGYFLVILLLVPLFGFWLHRRTQADVSADRPDARMRRYQITIAMEWIIALPVLVFWFDTGAVDVLFGAGDVGLLRWWIGMAAAVALCAFLIGQPFIVMRSPEKMAQARGEMEPLESLIPETSREARAFNLVSISAGICEEIIYRGFLILYLLAFFPLWVAAVGSTLIFGLGHVYQGVTGIVKTSVVGAVLAGLFLLTGSLWAAIVVHTVIDLTSGYLARRLRVAPQAVPVP